MKDILIGIDAGTSVIKSVAFSLSGEQLADSAIPNTYYSTNDKGVEQDPLQTWKDTANTLIALKKDIPDLESRVAAVSVTGQGDGTWLIDDAGQPVTAAWLWLDGRAGELVDQFQASPNKEARFNLTGTGFAACQQSAHLMWMKKHAKELIEKSTTAYHCKDWLYMQLTGERVTDPSEGCFTFGDFRTREYAGEILDMLDISDCAHLLPPMLDGAKHHHPLTAQAASLVGLAEGTPVILGYVDVICTALGAGLYDSDTSPGCTVVGSTGIHMNLVRGVDNVQLNSECTGFTMPMPIDDVYAQMQSNLASTLNIDWVLDVAKELLSDMGQEVERKDLIPYIEKWLSKSTSAQVLYQPYILEAGERGPIIDNNAKAGFIGLSSHHGFADLVRAVIEGLAMAGRDCYSAMGYVPEEIRLTGGAARSTALRKIFGNVLGTQLRTSQREEAGAAGAAMIAAVSIGCYDSMGDCVKDWVRPYLGELEQYGVAEAKKYDELFPSYVASRKALQPIWQQLNSRTRESL